MVSTVNFTFSSNSVLLIFTDDNCIKIEDRQCYDFDFPGPSWSFWCSSQEVINYIYENWSLIREKMRKKITPGINKKIVEDVIKFNRGSQFVKISIFLDRMDQVKSFLTILKETLISLINPSYLCPSFTVFISVNKQIQNVIDQSSSKFRSLVDSMSEKEVNYSAPTRSVPPPNQSTFPPPNQSTFPQNYVALPQNYSNPELQVFSNPIPDTIPQETNNSSEIAKETVMNYMQQEPTLVDIDEAGNPTYEL